VTLLAWRQRALLKNDSFSEPARDRHDPHALEDRAGSLRLCFGCAPVWVV